MEVTRPAAAASFLGAVAVVVSDAIVAVLFFYFGIVGVGCFFTSCTHTQVS